jgi:demethylmenaquinone methyltransferase/2-methoxy-6-polyprenyl-1,4-benzoquinol methylase
LTAARNGGRISIRAAPMTRSNESMVDYYARRAPEYERIYEIPERQDDLQILRTKLVELLAGRDVLEIACGTGFWTEPVSRSARSILATDVNEEVIAIARTKQYGPAEVRFAIADAYGLSALRGEFDAALAAFWWSHVPIERRESFLRALVERLHPGARIVLCDNTCVEGESTPICRTDAQGNTYQRRTLSDGSTHEVLKNYSSEAELRTLLDRHAGEIEYLGLRYYWCVKCRVDG